MKFTIFVTQECNLRCTYCYIEKRPATISLTTARSVVDFIFNRSVLSAEDIDIGFFGGEPLMKLDLIKKITELIYAHPLYDEERVNLSIVTNGTIFSKKLAEFVKKNSISLGISCDGPPHIHDKFRLSKSGRKTSHRVERNIVRANIELGGVMVNAVYHPDTFLQLPETVEYFRSLGTRQIYLSPDYSANWKMEHAMVLTDIYDRIGELYVKYYAEGQPVFISILDSKIAVILRGGYAPQDRCSMGHGEFAFTPTGDVYPCERLVGNGENEHCIGNVIDGLEPSVMQCHKIPGGELNAECMECGIKDYCMNWCGCSNFMASGYYNRVSPFLCASERAAIQTSYKVFQFLERKLGPTFYEHMDGRPIMNSIY